MNPRYGKREADVSSLEPGRHCVNQLFISDFSLIDEELTSNLA